VGLFAGTVNDPDLSAELCRACNRWLAGYCSPYPDRLFGAAMLPMQSVPHAIEEMRLARKELGFKSAFLRPNPYYNDDRPPRLRAILDGGRGPRDGDWIP
jgi:uncharacterized protein